MHDWYSGVMSDAPSSLSAARRAYEHTKQAIIRGDLPGGAAISEVAVCEELGLSRTPVHEAFLQLASEGLLTLESRKGAVVRPMSPREAADVLEMREAVESVAASRIAADGRGAEVASTLQPSLAEQEAALASGDVARFVEADAAFHQAVIAGSRNAIAEHVARLLADRQQRLRHQLMRVRPDQLERSMEQHRRLAAAIADDDAPGYAAALHEHVASHGGVL
jgi:DNA-binding GntR family transcriptional regulator